MQLLHRNTYIAQAGAQTQSGFTVVAPLLGGALATGVFGGFLFASILTLSVLFHFSGVWWYRMAQAHGHLQLYGWAGLFVLGVAYHFLPRLRGAPLQKPKYLQTLVPIFLSSLTLRAIGQTLLSGENATVASFMVIISAILEFVAITGFIYLFAISLAQGPQLSEKRAFASISILLVGNAIALEASAIVNLAAVFQKDLYTFGVYPYTFDQVNVTLGLLGFLVPMAIAMSAQSLPMYAGLNAFPRKMMLALSVVYEIGLLTEIIGLFLGNLSVQGWGYLFIGGSAVTFIGVFMQMMLQRGKTPPKIASLAKDPVKLQANYRNQLSLQKQSYGPFVGLVASAYLWALIGAVSSIIIAAGLIFQQTFWLPIDASRHSFTMGFIAMLIGGISARMIPGFSGGMLRSAKYITAMLIVGNLAAAARVIAVLLPAGFISSGLGYWIYSILFGLAGPLGLTYALLLFINLWPAIFPNTKKLLPVRPA